MSFLLVLLVLAKSRNLEIWILCVLIVGRELQVTRSLPLWPPPRTRPRYVLVIIVTCASRRPCRSCRRFRCTRAGAPGATRRLLGLLGFRRQGPAR